MLSGNNVLIPWPSKIESDNESFSFKVPYHPYLVERAGRKFLNRVEQWGIIEYDYTSDQFSALVNSSQAKPLPRAPLGLYWLVTAPCNLKCIHCYGNAEELPRENVSEKQQEYIADQIIRAGVMRVTLNGGEPLLRKDTPAIIEELADHNIAVILGTNGTYLNPSIMNSVRRTSLVEISFDSHIEATNNSIRVSRIVSGNAYQESLRGIDLCLQNDVKLRVLTCVNNRNIGHIEDIADLLYARGVPV